MVRLRQWGWSCWLIVRLWQCSWSPWRINRDSTVNCTIERKLSKRERLKKREAVQIDTSIQRGSVTRQSSWSYQERWKKRSWLRWWWFSYWSWWCGWWWVLNERWCIEWVCSDGKRACCLCRKKHETDTGIPKLKALKLKVDQRPRYWVGRDDSLKYPEKQIPWMISEEVEKP